MPVPSKGPFEALEDRLLRGGIAPRHVRRYLRELTDHLADLTQAEREAGHSGEDAASRARAALGPDTELADAMLKQRDFRSLSARFPWLVFGVTPPLTMLLAAVIQFFALIVLMGLLGMLGRHAAAAPPWFPNAASLVIFTSNLLVAPAIAALFIALAWHQRLHPFWPALAVLIVAALSLHWHNDASLRYPPGWSAVSLSYRYSSGNIIRVDVTPAFLGAWWKAMAAHGLMLSAQYLLTLLPLAWMIRMQRKTTASP